MAHPLVVHCRYDRFDEYIGRGSRWGNPFRIGIDGDRDEVVDLYEQWLLDQPLLVAALGSLVGKTLGCFCAPRRCHGEVLVRLSAQVVVPSPWGTTAPLADRFGAAPPF